MSRLAILALALVACNDRALDTADSAAPAAAPAPAACDHAAVEAAAAAGPAASFAALSACLGDPALSPVERGVFEERLAGITGDLSTVEAARARVDAGDCRAAARSLAEVDPATPGAAELLGEAEGCVEAQIIEEVASSERHLGELLAPFRVDFRAAGERWDIVVDAPRATWDRYDTDSAVAVIMACVASESARTHWPSRTLRVQVGGRTQLELPTRELRQAVANMPAHVQRNIRASCR